MLSYHHSKKKLLVFFYFLALLFAGLIIYDDYGISLDEDNTRINGFVTLKYIFSLFYENYIYLIDSIISVPTMNEWQEQGIGVVFDLPTALIELLFKIESLSLRKALFEKRDLLKLPLFKGGWGDLVFDRRILISYLHRDALSRLWPLAAGWNRTYL